MLVLARKSGQKILFPTVGITVEVLATRGNMVRLGIDAPRSVKVLREEIQDHPSPEKFAENVERLSLRDLNHFVRNRLHAASLGLHLFQKQVAGGMIEVSKDTLQRVLSEFGSIEQEVARFAARPPEQPESRPRALVVEDDRNESELLAGFLRMSGFDVDVAGDGADALDYLSQASEHGAPDVVLLDMMMPRVDGPTTVNRIRHNPAFAELPILAISGTSPQELGVPTGQNGINRWFPKPVNPEVLLREIQRIVHCGAASETAPPSG